MRRVVKSLWPLVDIAFCCVDTHRRGLERRYVHRNSGVRWRVVAGSLGLPLFCRPLHLWKLYHFVASNVNVVIAVVVCNFSCDILVLVTVVAISKYVIYVYNNNNLDYVYGAVIMASYCRSSPALFDECRLSAERPPTPRPSQSTWGVLPCASILTIYCYYSSRKLVLILSRSSTVCAHCVNLCHNVSDSLIIFDNTYWDTFNATVFSLLERPQSRQNRLL